MKLLGGWFEKGATWDEYVSGMQVNKENMLYIYEQYRLSDEDRLFYQQLRDRQWRVIALTADWCGDAMLCNAVLKRIAEAAGFELSFLIRDENLELMDQYLTNGKSRSIPIYIFIDRDGRERAVWGPRSPEVQRLVDEMRSQLPDKADPQFETKQKEMLRGFKERILTDQSLWETVNRSIRARLEEALR